LTELYLSKQCSDSANNNIGDKGALAIADSLKGLAILTISKQCSDSGNNNVRDKGVIAIADALKELTLLGISNQCSDSGNSNLGKMPLLLSQTASKVCQY
jgi:hypothetical protein